MSNLFARRVGMRRRFIGRISVEEKAEPTGYQNYVMTMIDGLTAMVFLNGEPQKTCITADSEEGWIKRVVMDGNKVVLTDDHAEFRTEIVRGEVEIRLETKR